MVSLVLSSPAVLSLLLLVWQWLVAIAFPLHRRVAGAAGDTAPAVSLLKPLKGADAETEACLRSWFTQGYPGPVELLFEIQDPDAHLRRLLGHRLLG